MTRCIVLPALSAAASSRRCALAIRPPRAPKSYRVHERLTAASVVLWVSSMRLPVTSTRARLFQVSDALAVMLGSQALSAVPSAAACSRAAAQAARVVGLRHSAISTAAGRDSAPAGG